MSYASILPLLLLFFTLISGSSLLASNDASGSSDGGGWVGAGGDTYTNSNNPWFFKFGNYPEDNTIKYCIKMDRQTFSSDPATAELLIKLSFQAWKNEFAAHHAFFWRDIDPSERYKSDEHTNFPLIEIATEELVRRDCADPELDIAFQFGVLETYQQRKLQEMEINPRDKVALAVRTQYDEKKLRAKGFIYFSPDSGKMRVKGDEKIEIIWKYQKIFLGILKHEWGHVLGVTHDVKPSSIMNANMPNNGVSRAVFEMMQTIYPDAVMGEVNAEEANKAKIGIFLPHDFQWMTCSPIDNSDLFSEKKMKTLRTFLQVSAQEAKCIFFDIKMDRINIETADTFYGPKKQLGVIEIPQRNEDDDGPITRPTFLSFSIKVVVTNEQEVFSTLATEDSVLYNKLLYGPFALSLNYHSFYDNGVVRKKIIVNQTSGFGLEIIGALDNAPEIIFRSPLMDM